MYAEYIKGASRIEIGRALMDRGIYTRQGKPWVDSNVKVILTNITYTGNMLFQKEYCEDPITKHRRKNYGELPQYGRFFKMYMYTALAPVPLSAFAGEPTQNIGKSFLKSYASVCLEGAIIVLACIIFSVFASSPPVVDPNAAPASMVWSYIGELIFNMLILVGAVKMADRLVKEIMGI